MLIFVGVSEGGTLVTALTAEYPDMMLATVN
jgi:pimeloyl-ACP methyl ester carboxylesterase